jgi:hypothetical protein
MSVDSRHGGGRCGVPAVRGARLVGGEGLAEGGEAVTLGDVGAVTIVVLFQKREDRGAPGAFQAAVGIDGLAHQIGGADAEVLVLDAGVEGTQQGGDVVGCVREALAGEPAREQAAGRLLVRVEGDEREAAALAGDLETGAGTSLAHTSAPRPRGGLETRQSRA